MAPRATDLDPAALETVEAIAARLSCPADRARVLTGQVPVYNSHLPTVKAAARLQWLADARAGRCDCTGCKDRPRLADLAAYVGISGPRLSKLLRPLVGAR
jgi:hypothetical protein